MRSQDVKNSYVETGVWNNESESLKIGSQMAYEWEQDFNAMKWALKRISEFLEVAKKNNHFTGTLHIAQRELLVRMGEYSCPSNLKEQYKKVENCPLKEKCKCCVVSDK